MLHWRSVQKVCAVVLESVPLRQSVYKPCGVVAKAQRLSWDPVGDHFWPKFVDMFHESVEHGCIGRELLCNNYSGQGEKT